ncbi:unnamed protein product [Bursaphelenchus xylophilus]|uniref:(pine wood nematode) hypothetical protein n=1 Tax=Bursaphelenchus xylophilus TaxID=6326 RepID=A0A7I8WJS2_BURXY|nr:unnamed protein product [Bursaphelenchus xylophilus]CAG9107662.1 unnamed protein product [Bursaphelenchus xylophilus]
MLIYFSLLCLLSTTLAQICPDGIPAAFECVKKSGQYKCTGDSSLGCEQINGVHFCCAVDPSKKPAVITSKVEKSEKNETDTEKESKGTRTTSSPDCYDKGPDCNRLKYLCDNNNYKDIMADQCPVACGICEDTNREAEGEDKECTDNGNDCPKLKYLCDNSVYRAFMKQECPKTCKTC